MARVFASCGRWAGLALCLGAAAPLAFAPTAVAAGPPVPAAAGPMDPSAFKAFKLQSREQISHDTHVFRFELPDKNAMLSSPVASCIVTKAPIGPLKEGTPSVVIRPYTPISKPDQKGSFDLLVKVYAQEGVMSKHFGALKPGDSLEMKGPITKWKYEGPGSKKAIGMVAGGTGITPMLQLIDAVLDNPADKTKLSLVFANTTEKDILLKDQLDKLAAKHADRFKITYVVSKPAGKWAGPTGYVTKELLKQQLPAASDDNMVFVCGPPGMMATVSGTKAPDYTQGEVGGILKELSYNSKQVFKF